MYLWSLLLCHCVQHKPQASWHILQMMDDLKKVNYGWGMDLQHRSPTQATFQSPVPPKTLVVLIETSTKARSERRVDQNHVELIIC